jgi:hypothetical protein
LSCDYAVAVVNDCRLRVCFAQALHIGYSC